MDLQPWLVWQASREQGRNRHGYRAPARAVVRGLFEHDSMTGIDSTDVGVAVEIIANAGIAFAKVACNCVEASTRPGGATIAGGVKALNVGAVVIVRARQDLLRVFRINHHWNFIRQNRTLRNIYIRKNAGHRTTGEVRLNSVVERGSA